MPRDVERFWRTTQNLKRFEYGPRAVSAAALANAGFVAGNELITLSGDVTGSGTTAINAQIAAGAVGTTEIANSNVTYAKIQNVTNNRVLGNTSGSAAAPSEITLPLSVANGGTGAATAAAAPWVEVAGDSMTGALQVAGRITAQSATGAVQLTDQTNSANSFTWLATADTLYCNHNGAANVMSLSGVGSATFSGTVAATGGTLTGTLNIAPSSGSASLVLDKSASGQGNNIYGYNGPNVRWHMEVGSTSAESGGNAGSDFAIHRFADGGTYLGTVFTVVRNTGNVGIGGATAGGTKLSTINQSAAGGICAAFGTGPNGSDTTSYMVNFTDFAQSVSIGAITRNGTNTVAYGTTSDERLKETIEDTSLGLDAVMDIRVCDYTFKAGGEQVHGLIAQQVYGIYPYAVHKGGDDPALEPWMIDYGRLVPLLIKAVQELAAEVATLKAAVR